MANLNKVFLIGRLTADPELRYAPSGTAVTDLRLAVNRRVPGRDGGEGREDTVYVDVTVWDRQAENCCQYLKKGRQIHIEGFLKMETWEDKATGQQRSKIKVQADNVQFLDSMGGRREDGGSSAEDEGAPAPARGSGRREAGEGRGGPGNGPSRGGPASPAPSRRAPDPSEEAEEDIPF